LRADFEALAAPATYRVVAADAWLRVKGHERLRGVQLAALQLLAAWREEAAQREDKPRKWLLGDDVLLAMAKVMPEAEGDLRRIRGLHARVLKQYAGELLALIRKAKSHTPELPPEGRRPPPLEPWQEPVVDVLSAVVKQIAAREDLHPSVLASRRDLERIVRGDRELAALSGWRGELLKAPLLAVLGGEQGLRVTASGLELT
jgi:ribonuclease D